MFVNLTKTIFAVLSMALIVSSNFVCVDQHGGVNFTFTHDVHQEESHCAGGCHSTESSESGSHDDGGDLCFDNHASCGEIDFELTATSTAPFHSLKTLNVTTTVLAFTTRDLSSELYIDTLYKRILPPLILEHLSTVVITT